ncbi:hypothetical protein GSI_05654 [Ganoderma sinense ZZ0214-1]|uniref:Uncharacterized protein n=1 Tax=Ganoderma sinense ZZ0214-1 TaxID=1077348 RepID=A0A2G8SFP4_9APHY|nr:hypothetical protein GSI_05654 [Ganoderma sinense ZZ0214-1]
MFTLTVTSTDVNFRYFIFGGPAGEKSIRSAGELFRPQGAKYIVGVAGKGYLTLTDVGNTVHGPGDWAVHATGSADH